MDFTTHRVNDTIKRVFDIQEMPSIIDQKNIEKWDSLGHLHLVLSLEKEFGVKFKMQEIPLLTSAERIRECVVKMLESQNQP